MDVNRAMRQSERRMTSSRRTPASARDRTPSFRNMGPPPLPPPSSSKEGKAIPPSVGNGASGSKKTRLTEGLL
jgi:hypothetical protein